MSNSDMGRDRLNRRDVLKTVGAASAAGVATTAGMTTVTAQQTAGYRLDVLSSDPEQVSGGDALVEVGYPADTDPEDIAVYRNEEAVTESFEVHPEEDTMAGVVDGFEEGENTLSVEDDGAEVLEETVINHRIHGPIFSGEHQQPYPCTTAEVDLDGLVSEPFGQPEVDNQDGIGIPVYEEEDGEPTDEIVGYSRFCYVEPRVYYLYRDEDGDVHELGVEEEVPDDVAMTTTTDGQEVEYVFRIEAGVINRAIYALTVLVDPDERTGEVESPDMSVWNGKLFFSFRGGTGIGFTQGDTSDSTILTSDGYALERGYAIAYSTALETGISYNLKLGGETAKMVKERFITRFGEPTFTISRGTSGGGVQSYVYGQNHSDLLDGIIPIRAFPDMITQTIHIGDCEPLEFYMDVVDHENDRWYGEEGWNTERQKLLGVNATAEMDHPFEDEEVPTPRTRDGTTDCAESWRGHLPRVINPHWGAHRVDGIQRYEDWVDVFQDVNLTHWDDAKNVYGEDDDGFGRFTWDNVGVQYGLRALKDGDLTKAEFLEINAHTGGWKQLSEFDVESEPWYGAADEAHPWWPDEPPAWDEPYEDLAIWDEWSARNMNLPPDEETPAPRTSGDMTGIQNAYEGGHVFVGDIDIPIIDWRQWMEPKLDQHNSHQSFAARQRIVEANGHADNQLVWFTDDVEEAIGSGDWIDILALEVMDEWLTNIHEDGMSVEEAKPDRAVDACFDVDPENPKDWTEWEWDESVIAEGDGVWDGIIDDEECGPCTERLPVYTQSRFEAGGPFSGDVFKCQLQPVEDAIDRGVYGDVEWTAEEVEQLKSIFPHGVCDYERPDAGYPHPSGLPRGVWDSVSVDDTTITPGELAVAEDAFEADEELKRIDRPMTEEEWTMLSDWAEDNMEGPQQIAEEFEGPPTPAGFEDGLLRDVNGDGVFDITDVQDLFENLHSEEVQSNAEYFNFSRASPDRVTVFDLQALFTDLQQQNGS